MNNPNIIKLNGNISEHIKAVSSLHKILLPESKVSQLGQFFLKHFYYKKLINKNLIDAYLYKIDDKFVGFIVCTDFPYTFMKKGIEKNIFYLSFVLLIAILLNPLRIKILMQMIKGTFPDKIKNILGENIGQFMSFGVLEEYRRTIDKETELSIPKVMMKKVFEHFAEKNKENFFLMVLKSNINAIKFYEKHDGVLLDECIDESNLVIFKVNSEI